jgi:FtsZ-binding cell division protein ZapB
MLRIYLLIVVFGIVGGAVYGAKYYYNTTQNTIAALRENNAKLETAVQISEDSVKMLQQDIVKNAELNAELQKELQTAELYGDELRATLNKHNLTHLANKKPGPIEKRMQNATDKLWDDLTAITDPDGVQQSDAGTKDNNGN